MCAVVNEKSVMGFVRTMKLYQILCLTYFMIILCDGEETRRTFRIVSGRAASIKDYPYQVSLEKQHRHWCGGSLIDPSLVLTAAHCTNHLKHLKRITPNDLRIRVACDMSETDGEIYEVNQAKVHEKYNPFALTDDFDVSVIHLTIPVVVSEKIRPIPMVAQNEEPAVGDICTVTGWGYQDIIPVRQERAIRYLMVVDIPVVSHEDCTTLFKDRFNNDITDRMICAGKTRGHMDACKGDSGGPLVVKNKLAGITAWGQGCGAEGIPGIYMSVAKFRPWIDNAINELNNNALGYLKNEGADRNHSMKKKKSKKTKKGIKPNKPSLTKTKNDDKKGVTPKPSVTRKRNHQENPE